MEHKEHIEYHMLNLEHTAKSMRARIENPNTQTDERREVYSYLTIVDARIAELKWVLSILSDSSEIAPPLQQADVMRGQSPEPLPDKAYCSECGMAVNSSRQSHYHWCSLAGNGA